MLKLGVVGGLVLGLGLMLGGCLGGTDGDEDVGSVDQAAKIDCSYVKCALPLCAEGQHLRTQGGCCPVCVGPEKNDRCAAVLCPAVACAEGEILVTSPGNCCGECRPAPATKECSTDADCPQIYCFACPCPVSECRGNQCVTETPDASTCGGSN